jgi:ketosteroid isomerase-like protein
MILSKLSKIFLLVACVALADARAADVDLEKAVGSLIAAEKAYAKLAGEKGFRDASISVFADDAVIFTPNAVNGKKFWRNAKEDPVLAWRPIFASISRSGELGYTTGPSEYRKSRDAQNPDAFGHFVTIWRKDAKAVWKVALDVGLDHPQPKDAETEIRTYVPNSPILQPESASTDLDKVQSEFAESLRDDEADAIIDHASDDIRVYRRGQLPAVGKAAAKKMLAKEDAKTSRAPLGAGTSHPIDLSYEYGEYTSESDKITQRGIYLTIWRLESDGSWKIDLDLQKSAPPEKKP